ncbi:hypothetical protein I312_105345 [Cryptococcus bacillisporus CA1280]|uniref:uncharacterized protein n=1 Tax=Cryptococcus bacillisporus CA1280 TaxID=1296109 RepID=UPI003366CBA0
MAAHHPCPLPGVWTRLSATAQLLQEQREKKGHIAPCLSGIGHWRIWISKTFAGLTADSSKQLAEGKTSW